MGVRTQIYWCVRVGLSSILVLKLMCYTIRTSLVRLSREQVRDRDLSEEATAYATLRAAPAGGNAVRLISQRSMGKFIKQRGGGLAGGTIFIVALLLVFWLSPVRQLTDSNYSMLLSESLLRHH